MRDYLGNDIAVNDTVILAMRSGRTATLGRGYVIDHQFRPQFKDGLSTDMILVEWSNINKFWMPASKVVKIPDEMLPEKRKERLEDVHEGVAVSEL